MNFSKWFNSLSSEEMSGHYMKFLLKKKNRCWNIITGFTLGCGFQQAIADTFWNKSPLENWVVSPSCA